MHTRWQGKWFRTLAFSQHTRTLTPDGKETKGVWHEALEHPGKLRIDFAPLESKAGLVCTPERTHHFKDGVQTLVQEKCNHLLLLLGDVYCQNTARTATQLEKLGFDLTQTHEATWNGRSCYVVGASLSGTQANQFWIDRETLLLQRVIQKDPAKADAPRHDVQIKAYTQVQGFPVATSLHFFKDGHLYFTEDYFDIRVNVPLDATLFDPSRFASVAMPLGPLSR